MSIRASWLALSLSLAVTTSFLGVAACGGASGSNPSGGAGDAGTGGSEAVESPNRVVGYLPTYRSLDPEAYDFDVLTHLCLAFANPTGKGSESDFDVAVRDQIAPLVTRAHEKNVLVLASIAGGTKASGDLVLAQIGEDKVDAYVASLLDVLEKYDLDGIDVDIEGEAVTSLYEPFVKKLKAALPRGKLLTAAVATKNRDAFSDGALAEYDFINVMSYDQCSWSDTPCDQASLADTEKDLEYWTVDRKIPKDKTVLGVPFYGWCWGCQATQSSLTYYDIAWQYGEEAKTTDWIEKDGVTITFNGPKTIETKAKLAKEYGGVMVWELGQDGTGEDSLLAVIEKVQ